MQSLLIAAVLLALGFGVTARGATPTTNPADLDREIVRRLSAMPDPIQSLADFNAAPVDAAMGAYVDQRRPVLALMHEAAVLPHADWGPVDTDVAKTLGALNGVRQAVQVTWIAARYDAAQGHPELAADALLSGLAMARHVGQKPLLICELVEVGCENGSIDRLAALLPKLPAQARAALPARLDALPPAGGFAAMIDGERSFGRQSLAQRFPTVALPSSARGPTTQTSVVAAMASGMDAFYDAAREAAKGSPAQFAAALDAVTAKMPLNVFVKTLAPSFARAREPAAMVEAKFAMLQAAAAIAAHGPATLSDTRDPFGPGPFGRTDTAGGYLLTSGLVYKDKPVTLTVGD